VGGSVGGATHQIQTMNKTTTSVVLCAALSLGALINPALAADPVTAPAAVPLTLTTTAVSQYMFRGVRLGGLCFQPSVEAALGDGALGVWSSLPLASKVDGVSDPEFDIYGSYSFKLSDAASLVPGFTWYLYPNADEAIGFYKSTFEPSLALNYTLGDFKITPKVYYDLVLSGPTAEVTAAVSLPLKDAGTSLDFAATVGTYKWTDAAAETNPALKNWGDYWQVGVSSPYQVSKDAKLVVGYAYTQGTGNYYKQGTDPKSENSAAVGRGVVTLSYSVSF